MTRTEFISRLGRLREVLQPVLYGGGALVILVNSLLVALVFRVYPLGTREPAAVYWYGGAATAACGVFGAFVFVLRRLTARYAPVCPGCRTAITWRERRDVLATGLCPSCRTALIDERA